MHIVFTVQSHVNFSFLTFSLWFLTGSGSILPGHISHPVRRGASGGLQQWEWNNEEEEEEEKEV